MGIEPTLSAWEAEVLPLNYTRPPPKERHNISLPEYYIIPTGCDWQTYLETDHSMEVCTLSRQGNRFIPYPPHYRMAFAFSIILYPLQQQITLRLSLSARLARRRVGLTTFRASNRVGKVPSIRR